MISLTSKTDRAMKKIFSFAAALAVMFLVSCNKEMNDSEGLAPEGKTVKVTVNATADEPLSKMIMNGKRFEWEIGDELKTTYYTGTLKAVSAGSGATFEGDVTGFPNTKANMYVFYSESGDVNSAYCTSVIPVQQSGLASDIKKHVVWSSWITTAQQHFFDASGKEISSGTPASVEIIAEMIPNFSILKFNVPQELGLTSISITADANIAGTLKVNAARIPTSSGNNKPEHRINRPSDGLQSTTIEVSRDGEVISGAVYVVIAPDAFDKSATPTATSWELYHSTATKLNFTFVRGEESMEYESKLQDPIQMGELKDLGTLPLNIMLPKVEAGKLCLTNATTLTVGVSSPNPSCTYYYEIGSSRGDCKNPTTASASFDPSEGFCPAVTGTFDRYYIKVLAHTEEDGYRDAVMTASLRNWKFKEGCPADKILSKVESGEVLDSVGDYENTSDGLELYRNAVASSGNKFAIGGYEATTTRIAYITARIQMNASVENDESDVWMAFYVDRNVSVSYTKNVQETYDETTGELKNDKNENGKYDPDPYDWPNKRGYRLFYNNSQNTDKYWKETVWANMENMNESGSLPSEKYTICLHLTDLFADHDEVIKSGDKFGLRGDGKHLFYNMAMLEVL